jgi:drug/metabolite transporter (DMT)-like permease
MTPRQLAVLLLLAALWGGSFPFMRVAAPALGPVCLIEARVLLAGLALLLGAALVGRVPAPGASFRAYMLLSALNAAIPFVLIAAAMTVLPAAWGATLNATTPLFGALVAYLWLREPLGRAKLGGLGLGVAGVATLLGLGGLALTIPVALGVAASLTAAALYAIAAVYARRAFAAATPLALTTYTNLGSALLLAPVVPFTLPQAAPDGTVVGCVVALALGSTAFAYLLYFWLIAQVGPVRAVTVTFLVPAFGILWAWAFLGEAIGWGLAPGAALIVASVVLTTRGR